MNMTAMSSRKRALPPEFVTVQRRRGDEACSALIVEDSFSDLKRRRLLGNPAPARELVYILVDDKSVVESGPQPYGSNVRSSGRKDQNGIPIIQTSRKARATETITKEISPLNPEHSIQPKSEPAIRRTLRKKMSSLKRAGHDREPRRVSPTLSVREARRPREQPRTFHISNRSIIPSSIPSKGRNRGGTQQTNHRIVLIENGLRERPSSGLRTPDKCLRHDGDTQYRSQDANQTSPAAPRFSPSPAPVTNVSAADLSRDQLSPVWADMLFEHTGRAEFRPQSSQLGISEVNGYSVREGSSANTCGNECPEPPRDHSADEVDLSDGTVYDTYRLTSDPPSVSPTTGTDDDGERLQPQISGSVGRVVIGDEDISLWQTLTNDESESDSYDEEEPDSNDERNPRNDYPDVERGEFQDSSDSDNPLRRRPSRSGKNSLDSDEEDGRMSGDDSDDDAFWR